MIDYIIVGNGLAGISFATIASQNQKSFVVFDDLSQPSTKVAGGLYNPVVLKRFSTFWKAKEQLTFASDFYSNLEIKYSIKIDYKLPIYRKLYSIEEQNNWFAAADKPILTDFLSSNLITSKYKNIYSPYQFGEVLKTGYVDTDALIEAHNKYLNSIDALKQESFDYSQLLVKENCILYKDVVAKHIIFAEGFGLHSNPYFNYLPLDGTKGEVLTIKTKELDLNAVIKSSVFILPLGNDLYKVGATYNWEDKTNDITEEGKKELVEKLKEIISCDFEIMAHEAGVRPTVKDRKPLLGNHYNYKNMFVLNGLGTRGVMLGPYLAQMLYDYIENEINLDHEVNISRFYKKMKI